MGMMMLQSIIVGTNWLSQGHYALSEETQMFLAPIAGGCDQFSIYDSSYRLYTYHYVYVCASCYYDGPLNPWPDLRTCICTCGRT